jgi:hypothetical protein
MDRTPVYSPTGDYLGEKFTIDRDRFDQVVDKIGRGLYFHAFGERVPTERESEVILSPPREVFENPVVRAVIAEGLGGPIGGQTFEYRIMRAPEPPGVALCLMLFFGTIPVMCSLLRPEAYAEYVQQQGDEQDQGP